MANKRSRSPEVECGAKRMKMCADEDDCMTCSICIEPIESTGSHRLVSLKCGHLFGDSCVRKWINECPARLKSCPECRATAIIEDIRILHSNRIVIADNDLDVAIKSELNELKRKMNNLQRIGILYTECQICDRPFTSELRKNRHYRREHTVQ